MIEPRFCGLKGLLGKLFDQRLVIYSAFIVSLTCTFCNSIRHKSNFVKLVFENGEQSTIVDAEVKKFIKSKKHRPDLSGKEGEVMQRIAFKMKLFARKAAEYKKRHDEIWPELKSLLKTKGIEDYSIFLDEETNMLFGILKVGNETSLDELPGHPVMQKWWSYMKDIMETNKDHSPVTTRLREVFYLP